MLHCRAESVLNWSNPQTKYILLVIVASRSMFKWKKNTAAVASCFPYIYLTNLKRAFIWGRRWNLLANVKAVPIYQHTYIFNLTFRYLLLLLSDKTKIIDCNLNTIRSHKLRTTESSIKTRFSRKQRRSSLLAWCQARVRTLVCINLFIFGEKC